MTWYTKIFIALLITAPLYAAQEDNFVDLAGLGAVDTRRSSTDSNAAAHGGSPAPASAVNTPDGSARDLAGAPQHGRVRFKPNTVRLAPIPGRPQTLVPHARGEGGAQRVPTPPAAGRGRGMIYSHPGEIPGLSPSTSVRQVGGNGGEAQAPTGMFSRNASARRSVGARSDGLGDSYVHGSDLRYIEQEKREAEFHPLSQPGPNSAPGSALTTHRHLTHLPNAPEGTVAPPEFDPGYRLQSFNDGEEKGAAEQLSLVGGDARYAAALNQVIRNQATDLFEARFAKLEAENQQLKKELQQLKAKQSSCWPSWFRCGKAQ